MTAAKELAPKVEEFTRFGGSRAQRDLLEYTYVNALLRSGDKKTAKHILSTRRPKHSKSAPIHLLN